MSRKFLFVAALLALLAFFIPIEHKYDKLFRFYALTLAPPGLSPHYEQKFYLYPSDIAALVLLFTSLFWFRTSIKQFFGHPIWIVFICALLSIIASPFSGYLIPYTRLLQLLTPLSLFSFLRTTFNEEERQKATEWIMIAIAAAALFQAGVAITQYGNQGAVGLRILSESNQFATFTAANGTQMIRSQGTIPHPNPFGGFMFLSILISYPLILKRRFYALPLPFLIFALALSFSRAALFAWGFSTLLWFGWMIMKKKETLPELRFIGKVVLVSTLATAFILGPHIVSRGGIVNYNSAVRESDAGRIALQKSALRIIQDHPLLGLGYSLFANQSNPYFPSDAPEHVKMTVPHNIFLFLGCETGLISLGAFIFSLLLLFWRLIKTPFTTETATLGALFIGFVFIGGCDFYLIFYQQGKLMFFLILGLIASHSKICYNTGRRVEASYV